jgi:hypothetical protein
MSDSRKRAKPFSVRLRERLAAISGKCPTCGGEGRAIRAIAKDAGVNQSVIFRVRHGKSISMGNLDKLLAWLERKEKR